MKNADEITVVQNKLYNSFTIEFGSNPVRNAQIEVFNSSGCIVFTCASINSKTTTINLANIEKGNYLIKIWAENRIFNHLIQLC
jgi:hypothetical protein